MIERPQDYIQFTFPSTKGMPVTRCWGITLPTASVSAAMRSTFITTMGGFADTLAAKIMIRDPEVAAQAPLLCGLDGLSIEALEHATLLLRNARAGRSLSHLAAYETNEPLESVMVKDKHGQAKMRAVPGVHMARATNVLMSFIRWWLPKYSAKIDIEKLYGVLGDGGIEKPGLVHQILYASQLDLVQCSAGTKPEDVNSMKQAGMIPWVNTLDDVLVSADELDLLAAFAFLHLFRPF